MIAIYNIHFVTHIYTPRPRLNTLVDTVGSDAVDGGGDLELLVAKLADDEDVLAVAGLLGLGPGVAVGGDLAGDGNAVLALLGELVAEGKGDGRGAEGR